MQRVTLIVVLALAALCATVRADDTLWVRLHGQGSTETGTAVATIGTDIYVAGTVTIQNSDILLVKYRGTGDTVWSRTLNMDTTELVVGVAVGSDSGPVVCVSVRGLAPSLSLVKLNKNGDTVWSRHRRGLFPTGVALDGLDDIYVYGATGRMLPGDSLALVKYLSNGTPVFDRSYRFGTRNNSAGFARDPGGDLVAGASIVDSLGTHTTLIKYGPTGDTLWKNYYPGPAGTELQGVAVAPNGCIVASVLQSSVFHVMKFTPGGALLWNESVPGHGVTQNYNSVAVDADSNIVAATMDSSGFGNVLKLNAQGSQVWFGHSYLQAQLRAIAVDAERHAIAVGRVTQPQPGCLTVKFSGVSAMAESRTRPTARGPGFLVNDILGPGQAISLNIPQAGSYTISVMTETGALLRQVHQGPLTQGLSRFAPGKLAAGSYYLRVSGPNGTAQEKFIQVR